MFIKKESSLPKLNIAVITGFALLAMTIAGCGEVPAAPADTTQTPSPVTENNPNPTPAPADTAQTAGNSGTPAPAPADTTKTELKTATAAAYKNGTYTATGGYDSPAGPETIGVTLTLKDDIVTDANVVPNATNVRSVHYQQAFISGYKQLVVGKKINTIQLDHVSGSSLTPAGFNSAVAQIMKQAKA